MSGLEPSKRIVRLTIAALIVVPTLVGSFATSSVAAPSKADVEAAKAKLAELNEQLEGLVERYNTARELLRQAEDALARAQEGRRRAEALESSATARLEARAVEAYTNAGSQLDVLLGAESFTQFSDRLEFMGALAQNDADIAGAAANARQHAEWARQEFDAAVAEREAQVDEMGSQLDQIRSMLDEQQALTEQLSAGYQEAVARQQEAAEAAEQAAQQGSIDAGAGSSTDAGDGGFVPPPNGTAAQIAIEAARSVIGTQYIFGSADPSTGFDCSGLTLWAYAKAGISLPHSSQMQYDMFPKVPKDQIQPGDLLFFFNPIHHVAIYMGGNSMIDTVHPGADGAVAIRSIWWDLYVGATRPT
jgi:cell wall-associated NlpC family hydrolase